MATAKLGELLCAVFATVAGGAVALACATPEDLSASAGTDASSDASPSDAGADALGDSASDGGTDATPDASEGDAQADAEADASGDVAPDVLPDATPLVGLGLWYKFDSIAGNEFDFSGNGNHGSVSGTLQRGLTGKIDLAFDFAGSDGRVHAKSSASLDMTTGGTIEIWIKLASVSAGTIVGRGTGAGDNSVRIKTAQGNIQAFFTRTGGASASIISETGVLPTGKWTHVAVVNTGSQLKLFIDGTLHMTGQGGQLGSMFADLYVGKSTTGEASFNGSIDDLRWWTVARTDQEVCEDAGGMLTTVDGASVCALP